MSKNKVKIVNGFKKTSSFGWRFVPKWKIEFIKLNGMNAFEVLIKGMDIQEQVDRNTISFNLSTNGKYSKFTLPKKETTIFRFHNGLDFIGSDNKLLAIADGVIIKSDCNDLSGNYIKVKNVFNGVLYLLSYCHLKNLVVIDEFSKVTQGEWIAVMGNTGTTSTGIHCHLTVRKFETGEIIDPETIFEFI